LVEAAAVEAGSITLFVSAAEGAFVVAAALEAGTATFFFFFGAGAGASGWETEFVAPV